MSGLLIAYAIGFAFMLGNGLAKRYEGMPASAALLIALLWPLVVGMAAIGAILDEVAP